jgi:hypothetical protein
MSLFRGALFDDLFFANSKQPLWQGRHTLELLAIDSSADGTQPI